LRGRGGRHEDDADEATVALSDDEHAWWASRDELAHAYVPPAKKQRQEPEAEKRSGFKEYFTAESLFTQGASRDPGSDGGDRDGSDDAVRGGKSNPYVVLGLPDSASWEQISTAHRRLAKLHHPDRLLDATPEKRKQSEAQMRELNIAYSELRRRRGM
jgi:DnaJ-domain-containing protein 1